MSMKFYLTCSYCLKIFQEPIAPPCGDSICQEHLHERDVLKKNKIQCSLCNKGFSFNDHEFKINTSLNNLLDAGVFWTDEEKILRENLEQTLKIIHELIEND